LRTLYSLIFYLLLPWVLLRLWWRGARVPGYRDHWSERFGRVQAPPGALWIHAVSVGEVRAAQPLVDALRRRWPEAPLVMTTTTPTGRDTTGALFGSELSCMYLPYDLPDAVDRFLKRLSPAAALVMETEIWPNLYHGLRARNVPLLLVNARLSERSLRGYRRLAGLVRSSLHCARCICAQTGEDAQRFIALGAQRHRVFVSGNLKFDVALPVGFSARVAAIRTRLPLRRPLWVAGSTHPGEEGQILQAHNRILQRRADALLLLAPRHPERARELTALCEQAGLVCRLYSETPLLQDHVQVVIIDELGELAPLYGVAGVAFVGGSLVIRGGHNPIEALLAGAPVLTGPHIANFQTIYEELVRAGAVKQVANEAELASSVLAWLGDQGEGRRRAAAGQGVIARQRGAAEDIVGHLEDLLPD
jgi:3-deoxy-D-manno-octulosonic-acid transferase